MTDQDAAPLDTAVPPPSSRLSLGIGLATILAAALVTVFFVSIDLAAAWFAGFGTLLMIVGIFAPSRGAAAGGVLMLAGASLFASSGESLPYTFLLNALMAVVCIALLLGADFSYATRRAAVVSPVTVQGMLGVHAIAVVIGLVLSISTLSIVLAVTWPGWLLLVPAVLMVAGVLVLIRLVRSYQQGIITIPQPPAPTGDRVVYTPGSPPAPSRGLAAAPGLSPMSGQPVRHAPPPPPPGLRRLPPPPPGNRNPPPPPGNRTTPPAPPR